MRAFVSPLGEINFPSSSVTLHPSTFLRTVEHVLEIFIRLTRSSWERRKLDGQWYIVWPIFSFAWINDKDTDKNFEIIPMEINQISSFEFQLKMDRKHEIFWNLEKFRIWNSAIAKFFRKLKLFFFFSIKKKFQQISSRQRLFLSVFSDHGSKNQKLIFEWKFS